mgnify:CR=1 FL=1
MVYYQTTPQGFLVGSVTPRVLRGDVLIPAGCVEVDPPEIPEGKRARWSGSEWQLEPIPARSPEPEINAATPIPDPPEPDPLEEEVAPRSNAQLLAQERDRRLAVGFSFDFGDHRGIHIIGTSADDMRGWDEVSQICDLIRRGVVDQPGIGISTETGVVEITPAEWDLVLAAAAAFRQPIWQASFALASMDPLPEDFTNDVWWP